MKKTVIGAAMGGGVAIAVIAIVALVPFVQVSYQESYQTTQAKQTSYQELENKQKTLFSQSDYTIHPNSAFSASAYVASGHQVEFSLSASDTVKAYIVSSDGKVQSSREDVTNARFGFTAPISDTYRLTVINPRNGIVGIGSKTVGLYSASANESWQELVTKHRNTTEPVKETRTVTTTVTLLESMMKKG